MRAEKLMVRVSGKEKDRLGVIAREEGLPTATWARRELLRRAAESKSAAKAAKRDPKNEKMGLLSLFCGPGGLDEGFKDAGFSTEVAIDINQECVNTFAFNHREAKARVADITKLDLAALDKIAGYTLKPVGVVGGPPCQSFSVSNVFQSNDDPRHKLAEAYAGLLSKLNKRNPISFFVFENVPGLLSLRHIHRYEKFKKLFKRAGFKIYEKLMDAQHYGVPQERQRIIIVGINEKKHPGKFWEPPKQELKIKTVADTIRGLPEPVHNDRGLDVESLPVHPNHWCLVPRSSKFTDGRLDEGQMFGRSFRTLWWDKPSWTVAYGHREVHVHPKGHRRLSMYEALLLQSFPKSYRLTGNMSAQIRLVSEAVPPRLAWHIAKSVRSSLGI